MGKKKVGKNAKVSLANAARDADIAQHSLSNRYMKVSGKKKKDAQPFHVDEEDDEVDAFHRENDQIDVDGEDESENDDEIEDRRPRLELGNEFDEQDEDEDEDEDDYAAPIPLRDSDDERETKEPSDISKAWGRKKQNYYDADTVDFEVESDEDVAKAEEEEVKRLDKEKSAKLKEEDFDVATLEDLITNKKKKPDLKKKSKKTGDTLKDLEFDTLENGTMEVERVAKDVSDLTKKDKLELLMSDSPELLGLLAELRTKLAELRDHIAPLIERVRAAKLPTSHGISLLEVKFHLLLNYVTNVAFYLMLKVDGQQVQHHPVIKQLVHLRTMMEKLKPIDAKLKYQIEKLIKQANTTSTSTSDPLSYKPNPDQLVVKSQGGDADDGDVDGVDAGDGIYRPPKMTAAHFDENEKAAKKRRAMEEKQRSKARSSGLVQHLRDELLSDAPATYHMYGDNIRQEDDKEKDKREYEETNMLRLMETKADRNARKRKERVSAMEDFEDFGDYDALIEDTRRQQQQEDEQLGLMKKKARTEKVDEILNKVKTGMSALNKKRKQPTVDDFSDDDDFESGTRAYAEASAKSRDKRAARIAAYPKPEIRYRSEDPNMLASGSKRAIDTTIQRNRGLTRARPKDTKTPRTANREKYRKAVIRRKGQVQEFKGVQEGLNYSGEKTGIKKNVTKSVKIR